MCVQDEIRNRHFLMTYLSFIWRPNQRLELSTGWWMNVFRFSELNTRFDQAMSSLVNLTFYTELNYWWVVYSAFIIWCISDLLHHTIMLLTLSGGGHTCFQADSRPRTGVWIKTDADQFLPSGIPMLLCSWQFAVIVKIMKPGWYNINDWNTQQRRWRIPVHF